MPFADPGLGFRLGQQEPLPVQVEPVVIGPRFHPQIMDDVGGIGVLRLGEEGLHMVHPARMAVGIEHGGEQQNRIVERVADIGFAGGREVVKNRNGRVHARGFRAVNAEIDPQDQRRIRRRRFAAQSRQMRVTNRVDPLLVLRRGDGEEQDRAVFVGVADRLDRDAVRLARDLAQIGDHVGVTHGASADFIAETVFRRRDGGVIADVFGHEEGNGFCDGRRAGQCGAKRE